MLPWSLLIPWLHRLVSIYSKKEATLLTRPLQYNLRSLWFIRMREISVEGALWYTGIRRVMLHPLIFVKKHRNMHIATCIWMKKETPLQASVCTVNLLQVFPARLQAWKRLIKNTVACRGKTSSGQLLILLRMDFPSLANKQANLTTIKNVLKSLIQMEPQLYVTKNGIPAIYLCRHN